MSSGADRARHARTNQRIAKFVLGAATVVSLGVALSLIGYIFFRGWQYINWEFLTQPPRSAMTEGGIYPAIVGTFWLVIWTAIFALPFGIMAGIYLSEIAPKTRLTRVIRLAIANMAGVPSIVYGLFGVALFVLQINLGRSIMAGALTLACLTLPVIITATEEALQQIPRDLRYASLAMGETKLGTIRKIVMPAAGPGIITGSILALSRAAGETAPILFTAVAFFAAQASSPFDETMALPYHLYIMATSATKPAPQMIWGTAFVLVFSLSIINVIVATWRSRQRSKVKW
jgi:phosphate transport system permease protein